MHAGVLDITITLVIFHCREPKNNMFYVIGVISGARFVQRWPDILPKDTLPKDILPKDILPNGHFADGRFAERTFCRTDILPNGHFAERTVCRTDNLPKINFRQVVR
jgi:hypothetical protein